MPQKLFQEARSLLLLAFSAAPCKEPCYLHQADDLYSLPDDAADGSGAEAAAEAGPVQAAAGLVQPKAVQLKHVLLRNVLSQLHLPAAM